MQSAARPLGVTIVSILQILTGIIGVVGGLALFLIGGLGALATPLLLILKLLGVVLLVLGAASFIMAYGLWKGKRWAWLISLIFTVVWIVVETIGLIRGSISNIISIALNSFMLFYLTRSHVKAFFNGGQVGLKPESVAPLESSQLQSPSVIFPKPTNPDPSRKYCISCGFPLLLDWRFCPTCATQQM